MLFILPHAFVDGVSWASCLESLTNEPNLGIIGKQYKPNIFQRIAAELMAPIGMLKVIVQLLLLPFEKNVVKQDPGDDRSRLVRISDDINVADLKKACK